MLTTERKAHILALLAREGRVVAKSVSADLQLSEDTIRRDLRELAAEGLLQRVHGGALPASPALADLQARRGLSGEGKAAIARRAAAMVTPGQTVILDGGTTAIAVAKALPADLKATVITHSPDIAVALSDHAGVTVELIGGRIYRHSNVAVGAVAAEAIARLRADLFFLGVTGLHPEFGLTTGDREEAAIKRALCRQAAETVVLASREKLGAVSACEIVPLAKIDAAIVEKDAPGETVAALAAAGLRVIAA